ncbi:MAG TPA: hypothetical protein VHD90_02725, partial [Phototrophicaceae bacterium]|nr:hypothetical protein [Phototrophicaceae bacterium]
MMMSAPSPQSADWEASVSAMAKVGGCWSPSFSPAGKTLAFISNLNGNPQVWTTSLDGGWPELVTALNDQISVVRWSPDGQWLAFRLAPGGGMNEQVYLVHPDGSGLKRLTLGGKETNWLGFWSEDSRTLTYSTNLRDPNAMDACTLDIASGESQIIVKNRGTGSLTDISKDGRSALLYRLENRSSSDLFLIDVASGAETCLTAHEGPGNFTDARFAPDGKTIYLTSDMGIDLVAFGRIRLDDAGKPGAIEIITQRDDAQLDEFVLTDDGKIAALVWNVAGRSELVLIDPTSGQQIAAPALPAEVIFAPTFSADGAKLAFTATGSTTPRDIWVYDLKLQALTQITHSPHPAIALAQLVQPELVHFKAHDGLDLSAWLYRPHNFKAPGPIVLSFHGG